MVLLKGLGPDGLRFFTNYESRKGRELDSNPFASLVFYWEPLCRQVRDPRPGELGLGSPRGVGKWGSSVSGSAFGAVARAQGWWPPAGIKSLHFWGEKVENEAIPCLGTPWVMWWPRGAYLVEPEVVEFWQGQSNRLHDRIVFRRVRD
ncbi:PNPO oxidase, partial [Loxia leucoptera]|nr:PNPO oxidase [Loxia leucoptera]